ncbi:MAG: flavin reductase family protein [Deltaproteobacteria bacterium]|nr:flavin reductase family protein [Deltaproteobacteria bacterium]MBW2076086.1 flavin reductase family protein [Deltaproteobacteria bacterium]MBW2311620.1 flavin reductase family protein [Deltaproteobacteria bacterium]
MEKTTLGPQALLYPMPAALIGAQVDGKPNYMTAAWCAIAALKPPSVAVAIRRSRYTLKGVREQGTFSVNVPSSTMAKEADYCGLYSGKNRDKSRLFTAFYGELKTAPLITECPLNLECKAIHFLDLGSHTLVVGEIMQTYISGDCLTDGNVDPGRIDPLIFISGASKYHRLGDEIAPAFAIGKD